MTTAAPLDRLSIPAPGRTLLVEAEQWGRPVRDAVEIAQHQLLTNAVVPPLSRTGEDSFEGWSTERTAWFVVNAWLLSRRLGVVDDKSRLVEGLQWFCGPHGHCELSRSLDDGILTPLWNLDVESEGFLDLLPYLLDADGLATRRAVLRDPKVKATRQAKKRHGVVYTPADVVEHMVEWVHASPIGNQHAVLDPACGTGAYLVAALESLAGAQETGRLAMATSSLYGIDVNDLSLDSCAFVLLHHATEDMRQTPSPIAAWRAVRMNLARRDTLTLRPSTVPVAESNGALASRQRVAAKMSLLAGNDSGSGFEIGNSTAESVGDLFPEVAAFNAIVTNPPYAPLGNRDDFGSLASRFDCLSQASSPATDMYLPFTEFCWRLAAEHAGRAAVVVPLSVAFSQRPAYRALRQQLAHEGGSWVLSFYDRTPDALFGDDVKQRTAILRFDGAQIDNPTIRTGPLQRWTSRNRRNLFVDQPGILVEGNELNRLIPKLGTKLESDAYSTLRSRLTTLETSFLDVARCSASTTVGDPPEVFVAGTAYNWISAALHPPALVPGIAVTSQSPLHRLRFGSQADAQVAYSVLSSRVVYWLWRVEGDGFHVSRWFLTQLPISLDVFTGGDCDGLSQLGEQLWEHASRKPVVSLNGGSTSVSFDPAVDPGTLAAIDAIVCGALGLPAGFDRWLSRYMEDIKTVERPLRVAQTAEEVPSWH